MNNNISPMNSVNFQAKLDISKVKGSKQRWQNIARLFEEKTKRYPNDALILDGSFKRGIYVNLTEKGLLSFDETSFSHQATARLKKLSDKDIVKNIVDVFKYLRNIEPTLTKQEQLAARFNLHKMGGLEGEVLRMKFDNIMYEIREANNKKFIAEHPVFKNGGIDLL